MIEELNLPSLLVKEVVENERDIQIEVVRQPTRTFCLKCYSENIIKHGSRKKRFMDIPRNSKPVILVLNQQRYRCKSCGFINPEEVSDIMNKRHQMTKRLVTHIVEKAASETFVSVSEKVGVNERTVRTVFRHEIEDLIRERNRKIPRPTWLDIRAVEINGTACSMLTDRETGYVLDMAEGTDPSMELFPFRELSKEDIDSYKTLYPYGKVNVSYITSDFNSKVKAYVNEHMPGTTLMISKEYIPKRAVAGLLAIFNRTRAEWTRQETRKFAKVKRLLVFRNEKLTEVERGLVQEWQGLDPAHQKAYELKEAVFDLLDSKNGEEARERIKEWIESVTADVRKEFMEMMSAFTQNLEAIVVAFDHVIPNEDELPTSKMDLRWYLLEKRKGHSFEVAKLHLVLGRHEF